MEQIQAPLSLHAYSCQWHDAISLECALFLYTFKDSIISNSHQNLKVLSICNFCPKNPRKSIVIIENDEPY